MISIFEKTAKTRAQKEWQKAHAQIEHSIKQPYTLDPKTWKLNPTITEEGREELQKYKDQIAHAYGDLGLRPRELRDISTGGREAAVDLMMGVPQGPRGELLPGGYVARKLYKADSPLHRGDVTGEVLKLKQDLTDKMLSMPSSRPTDVVRMAGYESPRPGRYVSYHEYVPKFRAPDPNSRESEALEDLYHRVIEPMGPGRGRTGNLVDDVVGLSSQEIELLDTGRIGVPPRQANIKVMDYKPKNIAMEETYGVATPRIMDFVPQPMDQNPIDEFLSRNPDLASASKGSVSDVRKDVFRKAPVSGARKDIRRKAPLTAVAKSQLPVDVSIKNVPENALQSIEQAPKIDVGSVSSPKLTGSVSSPKLTGSTNSVVRRLGSWAREHPGRFSAAIAAPAVLGLGAYGLHKLQSNDMQKAAMSAGFFSEMLKLYGSAFE